MSLKTLPKTKKHVCPRQNCTGSSKQYDNYLHELNKTKAKGRQQKSTRSHQSLQEKQRKPKRGQKEANGDKEEPLVKQLMGQLQTSKEKAELDSKQKREQISILKKQIKEYQSSINNYDAKIRTYEGKLQYYQNLIAENQRGQHLEEYEGLIEQYREQLSQSQQLGKEITEKWKMVEIQYHQYRTNAEKNIEKMAKEMNELKNQRANQRELNSQIEVLKHQVHRLSQEQRNQDENQLQVLRQSNRKFLLEHESLLYQLGKKDKIEKELKINLDAISRKVEQWEIQYSLMNQQRRDLEERYNNLLLRYNNKKEKQVTEKEQWAQIFRELVREVEKLKKEIGHLQRTNERLTNLYVERQE